MRWLKPLLIVLLLAGLAAAGAYLHLNKPTGTSASKKEKEHLGSTGPDLIKIKPIAEISDYPVMRGVTLNADTKVYFEADDESEVIHTYPINTELQVLEEQEDKVRMKGMICIMVYDSAGSGTYGYVKEQQVADYCIRSEKDSTVVYFIETSSSGEQSDTYIYKVNTLTGSILAQVVVKDFVAEELHVYDAKKWQGAELLFSLEKYGDCCGCTNTHHYFLEGSLGLQKIFETHYSGESYTVEDGVSSEYWKKDQTLLLPADPAKDPIVFVEKNSSGSYDADGKVIREEISKNEVRYYKWDGKAVRRMSKTS